MSKIPVEIIAEIGINHDGSLIKCQEMIAMSAEAGADYAKFQLLKADHMYLPFSGNYKNASGSFPIYDIVKNCELKTGWIPTIFDTCAKFKIKPLFTVYDLFGLEELCQYDIECIKLASYEIEFLQLFRSIAQREIPLIFSTAGASISQIDDAVNASFGCKNLTIMHCNGKYPADRNMVNLAFIKTLRTLYPQYRIGFSDHTLDPLEAPIGAVRLGASIIEKHVTMNRQDPGVDHSFAIEPQELELLCTTLHNYEYEDSNQVELKIDETLYGDGHRKKLPQEDYIRKFCYRSLRCIQNIKEGEKLSNNNIEVLRNGELARGFHPDMMSKVLGIKVVKDIKIGDPIDWSSINCEYYD